jgi:hypothetical protein
MNHLTITELHYTARCSCGQTSEGSAYTSHGETELESCQADLEERHFWVGSKCGKCWRENRRALRGDDERKGRDED